MIILIAAMDPQNGIGKNGALPWHIKEDLALFKEKTLNHKIVMGRKTFESIGKPLPNRLNCIVSRNKNYTKTQGIEIINNLDEFLKCNENTEEIIYIIGGAEIYAKAILYAKRLAISFIKDSYNCDTFFPKFELNDYKEIESYEFERFRYSLLEKK